MMKTVDDLTSLPYYDLRKKFPRPYRSIIRRAFWWIASYVAMLALLLTLLLRMDSTIVMPEALELFNTIAAVTIIVGALVLAGKLIYEIFFHFYYYYGIEEGHLVVSAGIFLKERGLFPIAHITDVYLDRGPMDFLFGLYNLYTSNPSGASHAYSDIYGLSTQSAVALQDYLTKLAEAAQPANKQALRQHPPEEESAVATG